MRIRSLKSACSRAAATRARRWPIIFRCCARRRTSFRRKARCVRHCVPAMSSLLPAHTAKRSARAGILEAGARVIDLSADYRFDDKRRVRTARVVPRRDRERARSSQIRAAIRPRRCSRCCRCVALATRPMQIIVDAKSGITGAGRKPATGSLFAEVAATFARTASSGHRHQPEIERMLRCTGSHAPLVFTPHVVPLARGMLADSYARLRSRTR